MAEIELAKLERDPTVTALVERTMDAIDCILQWRDIPTLNYIPPHRRGEWDGFPDSDYRDIAIAVLAELAQEIEVIEAAKVLSTDMLSGRVHLSHVGRFHNAVRRLGDGD